MSSQLLTSNELAARWRLANNTLRKWRVSGYGPPYLKLGDYRNAEVRYRLEDIEEFERQNRFVNDK